MSVVTYNDIHTAVAKQIEEKLNRKYISVEKFPGTFTEQDIRRLVTKPPSIKISLLNIDVGERESALQFVAWVIVRPATNDNEGFSVVDIVQALTPIIAGLDFEWCYDGGKDIKAETVYTGSLDKINVSMWAVEWTLNVRGSAHYQGEDGIVLPDTLEDFEGYDATHLVGSDKVEDIVNLED